MNYFELFNYFKEKSEKYSFGFQDYNALDTFACRITKDTMIFCDKRWMQIYGAVKSTKSPQIETSIPLSEIESVQFSIFPPKCEIKLKNNAIVYIESEFKSNFKHNYEIDLKTFPYIGEFKL